MTFSYFHREKSQKFLDKDGKKQDKYPVFAPTPKFGNYSEADVAEKNI